MKNVRAVKSRHTRDNSILVGIVFLFIILVLLGIFYMYKLSTFNSRHKVSDQKAGEQAIVLSEHNEKLSTMAVLDKHYLSQNNKKYFRVKIQVTNISNDIIQFSPLLQLKATSRSGIELPFTAELTSEPVGGPIPIGSSVIGDVDFEVTDAQEIQSLLFKNSAESKFEVINL